ncbi:MAG: ATP-binding protein [Bacteroidales bacterium]|nr:ATP-binding protein [Bacteroidales bacterium]
MEIEFYFDKKIYAYGLDLDNSTVLHEWLYESGIDKADKLIFERKFSKSGKTTIKMGDKFIKSKKDQLLIELMEDNLLKNNELLIGKTDNLKIQEIINAKNWFQESLRIILPHSKFGGLVPWISESKKYKIFVNELLNSFDTGIDELDTEVIELDKYLGEGEEEFKKDIISAVNESGRILIPEDSGSILIMKKDEKYIVHKVISYHKDINGDKVQFDLDEESDGTQRLLDFIPAFEIILNEDVTFVIDEIDHSIHPALLKTLVQKLMSDDNTKGQLIFTTHESNLLDMDLFRQDEIWFTEKIELHTEPIFIL